MENKNEQKSTPKEKAIVEKKIETSKQKLAVPERQSLSEKKKEVVEIKPQPKSPQPSKSKAPSAVGSSPSPHSPKGKLALILVRGLVRIKTNIVSTLFTLRLRQRHACVVLDDTPANRAAAMKCKDYIAYGEISEETHKLLIEKRGKMDVEGKLKKYFLLHPPRGGFERKGIKTPFTNGGALGYRGAKMNDLVKKML